MAKQVKITWVHSTGNTVDPTSHIVQRSATENGTYTTIYTALGVTAEHTDVNVLDGETWWYRVGAVFASGTIKYLAAEDITISETGYLLDNYANSIAAYSLRQLKTGVTSVVKVRRDSDDAELDFTATEITDGTLITWVGSGSGFIRIWYDQSGNGKNLYGVTTAQPIIVDTGALVTKGSKPTIKLDGINDVIAAGSAITELSNGGTFSIFSVSASIATETNGSVFATTQSLPKFMHATDSRAANIINTVVGSNIYSLSVARADTDQRLQTFIAVNTLRSAFDNGAAGTSSTDTLADYLNDSFTIGKYQVTHFANINLQELIIFNDNKTSDRIAIESEINTNYTIY